MQNLIISNDNVEIWLVFLQLTLLYKYLVYESMWFSGRKFRRVRCENIDELLAATNGNDEIVKALQVKAPLVSYTVIDGHFLRMDLDIEGRHLSHCFKLGVEQEMERRDGQKVKITYTLEGDSVLKQTIKMPDGKVAYFRREFYANEVKMTVTMDGTNHCATIYYEIVL